MGGRGADDCDFPMNSRPHYCIRRCAAAPALDAAWDNPTWATADTLQVAHFHARSSRHRPQVEVRQLHDDATIYTLFRVHDRYVRSVQTALNGPVCTDSCVEFFVRPCAERGYLNFEINAGGTLHLSYIEDPTRTENGFARWKPVPPERAAQVRIASTLPRVVEPEITEPLEWRLAFAVPLALLESYVGPLRPLNGAGWRANYYKCGDRTSHPHWAAWAPVNVLNFHQPDCFGTITFG
jgi:hypothetical protein